MWDAKLYEQFKQQRIQPSIDLANRVSMQKCNRILDVGCGSGMSTKVVQSKWPKAEVIGIDRSENMLTKAKMELSQATFLTWDCNQPIKGMGTFDLIFSNASIQWLEDQHAFIKRLPSLLTENGVFAVQIPDYAGMDASRCIQNAITRCESFFQDRKEQACINYSIEQYYSMITESFSTVELWMTEYYHSMRSVEQIVEFFKGSALRPYLERVSMEQENVFLDTVKEELAKKYQPLKDGTVLFPFRRIFFVAREG